MRHLHAFLLACTLVAPAAAQEVRLPPTGPNPTGPSPPGNDQRGTWAFVFENDTFSGNDRYYTNGFLFAYRSPSYDPPAWMASITEGPGLLFPGGATRWGVGFGQKIWTPEDTLLRDPDPTDRPYAAWLYGAITLVSYTETAFGSLELQVGMVGPAALGEQVQNNTHDIFNIERAYGWAYQIKDEFGVNLVANRQWRFNRPTGWDGISVGVVPTLAASLGNVSTYAGAGVMLRVGSELDADFGPPRVRPVSVGSVFYDPSERWGWYAFAGVEGRAVLRDISLDGNTWRESRSVDRETWVGDASAGVALFTPWGRVTAAYTARSKEFTTQREIAQFGSLSLAVRF
jgi:lipid A 3-O-deacylase